MNKPRGHNGGGRNAGGWRKELWTVLFTQGAGGTRVMTLSPGTAGIREELWMGAYSGFGQKRK